MPELARLQSEFGGKGLKVICITDESVDVVKKFLQSPIDQDAKAFAGDEASWRELCQFWIAADPDTSTIDEYMNGTGSSGTPVTFLVGKTGKLEWFGHPAEARLPVNMVANNTWDHQAIAAIDEIFAKATAFIESQAYDDALAVVNQALKDNADNPYALMILSRGKADILSSAVAAKALPLDDALKGLDEIEKLVPEGPIEVEMLSVRFMLLLTYSRFDELCPVVERIVAETKGDSETINGLTRMILDTANQIENFSPGLMQKVRELMAKAVESDSENSELLYTWARVLERCGEHDKAIEIQRKAVRLGGENLPELQEFLEKLQSRIKK